MGRVAGLLPLPFVMVSDASCFATSSGPARVTVFLVILGALVDRPARAEAVFAGIVE
jgi:hypothetical protein